MRQQRDIRKVAGYATTFGTSSHIILPKMWDKKKVIAMLLDEWEIVRERLAISKGGVKV